MNRLFLGKCTECKMLVRWLPDVLPYYLKLQKEECVSMHTLGYSKSNVLLLTILTNGVCVVRIETESWHCVIM